MDLSLATMLATPLMQRALAVAVLVGVAAPVMGTYLVQRRLALLGDGIGHVSLTGVAVGWLAGSVAGLTPVDALAVPGAVVAAVLGSVLIEAVRARGRTSGDLALALLFYGGLAGGVLVMGLAGGTTASLNAYLFGSISTVTTTDVWVTLGLAGLVIGVGVGLRPALFAVTYDEEHARTTGLPVRALNMAVAVMAALTVTVAMRVVGVLLVSALMIVPVAVAQVLTGSFRSTMRLAMGIGAGVSVVGLTLSYFYPLSPGALIVLLAIGIYAVVALLQPALQRAAAVQRGAHPDIEDDVQVRQEV